jgi:hypothetical protein
VEYMSINIPRINVAMKDQQEQHQSHMIEVECRFINHLVYILIDSRESHSYIDPKIVDIFHLKEVSLKNRGWFN